MPPSWSKYCLFSFSGSTILSPAAQLFKECREVSISFLSRICKLSHSSFLTNLSYSGINSHISKIMSIQSLVCWNEMKDFFFFGKDLLKIKLFGQKPNTRHSKYVIIWLSCILKKKLIHCKIKMAFFMVLCIHFRLWFWVYLLMVCDEVICLWISKKQDAQVKTQALLRKVVSFYSTYFISMHNNK